MDFQKRKGWKSHLSGHPMPSIPSLGKEWVCGGLGGGGGGGVLGLGYASAQIIA